jgi:hypothetical protein
MNERAECRFTVGENEDGKLYIICEFVHDSLQILGRGSLGFDLRKGITLRQAEDIAKALNDNITHAVYWTW